MSCGSWYEHKAGPFTAPAWSCSGAFRPLEDARRGAACPGPGSDCHRPRGASDLREVWPPCRLVRPAPWRGPRPLACATGGRLMNPYDLAASRDPCRRATRRVPRPRWSEPVRLLVDAASKPPTPPAPAAAPRAPVPGHACPARAGQTAIGEQPDMHLIGHRPGFRDTTPPRSKSGLRPLAPADNPYLWGGGEPPRVSAALAGLGADRGPRGLGTACRRGRRPAAAALWIRVGANVEDLKHDELLVLHQIAGTGELTSLDDLPLLDRPRAMARTPSGTPVRPRPRAQGRRPAPSARSPAGRSAVT